MEKTTKEIITELLSVPDLQKHMEDKRRRRELKAEEFRKNEQPIMRDLQKAGYHAGSLNDLVNAARVLPDGVVQVLLKWVGEIEDESVLEMTVRSLAASRKRSFDGTVLAERFDKAEFAGNGIRWVIANTIESALPRNITEWVLRTVQTSRYREPKGFLCSALVKMLPKEQALPVLISVFDECPSWIAGILRRHGGAEHVDFLKSKEIMYTEKAPQEKKGTFNYNAAKLALKEIRKAIAALEKKSQA